jgi:MFS family permease
MRADQFSTKTTLLLVSSLTVMAGATIAPALPSMQTHFSEIEKAGLWIRLVLTLPGLFIVLAAPLAGWFLDRNGRLRLLVPAMILYGMAGSSGLYLDSIGSILAGRALLGVAVAGIMTCATTLVADYYQGAARSKFMGWQAAFMNLGGVVFLTAGGGLTELGWRWPFAIYTFAILLVPLVIFCLPEPGRINKTQAVRTKPGQGMESPIRLMALIYCVAFGAMIIFYFIPLQIPFYLKSLANAGPSIAGLSIAVSTLFATASSFSYGRIRARLGYVPILGLNFGLMGLGYLLIGTGNGYPAVLSGLAVGGLGMGLMFPNLNVWLTTKAPAAIRGRAVGGMTTAVFLGQFLSPIAGQPIVDAFGMGTLFFVSGGVLLGVAAIFIIFRRRIHRFVHTNKKTAQIETAESPEIVPQKIS